MMRHDWCAENPALVELLRERLGDRQGRATVVDDYELLMASMWTAVARLLGDGGMGAVTARSIHLASSYFALLKTLQIRETEVDFGGLRDHLTRADCDTSEVLDGLLCLSVMVFRTLTELCGDAVTAPLLKGLGGDR